MPRSDSSPFTEVYLGAHELYKKNFDCLNILIDYYFNDSIIYYIEN